MSAISLLDLVTGGKSSESSRNLNDALRTIQGVKTPTIDDMTYAVKQLVVQGKITPQQAKAFLADPNALASMDIDQSGTMAQEKAISGMLDAAARGGLNPQAEAEMAEIIRDMNTASKGANDSVLQNAAARGTLTGGTTIAAQLLNNQNAAENANANAQKTAAAAYQQMLNELSAAGTLGNALQGQQNQQANTVGAATNEINKFNAVQQQGVEDMNVNTANNAQQLNLGEQQRVSDTNTGNANAYSAYKAQLPQQVFQNNMQKATGVSNVYGEKANNATQQGNQQATLIGNIIGTGGRVAAGGMGKPSVPGMSDGGEICEYLNGGQVEGRAEVPGDSPKNDTVLAKLSPGEIVLPRSIAQQPNEDDVMSFLHRVRQKKEGQTQINPEDTAHMLKALSIARGSI